MTAIPDIRESETITRLKPGPRPFYGEELVRVIVRMVPALADRLVEEAIRRNKRDHSLDRWNASRVAHEDLCRLYGIEIHPREDSNGS